MASPKLKTFESIFLRDSRRTEVLRFLVAGVINSVAAYLVYLLLLRAFSYPVAYTISYLFGICSGYYVNVKFVFLSRPQVSTALRYPVVYLIQYTLAIILLYLFVSVFGIDKAFAPLLILFLTVPITYSVSRYILRRNSQNVKGVAPKDATDCRPQ